MPSRGPRNAGGPPRAVFIAARSVSFRPPGRHYSCMATPTAPTVSARIGCRRMAPGKASLFPYFRRCVMSKHRRFAPRVELLEHRWCPSCTVTVHGDVMRIVGDGGVNAVTVTDDGAGNVTAACDTASATGSGIRKIIIDTKGGADTVTVDVTQLFSLRENAIAKEPGSSYFKPRRCVSRLGLANGGLDSWESSPYVTLSRGAFSASSLVTPTR